MKHGKLCLSSSSNVHVSELYRKQLDYEVVHLSCHGCPYWIISWRQLSQYGFFTTSLGLTGGRTVARVLLISAGVLVHSSLASVSSVRAGGGWSCPVPAPTGRRGSRTWTRPDRLTDMQRQGWRPWQRLQPGSRQLRQRSWRASRRGDVIAGPTARTAAAAPVGQSRSASPGHSVSRAAAAAAAAAAVGTPQADRPLADQWTGKAS